MLANGFYTALGTPLTKDGKILEDALIKHIDQQIDAGTSGLLLMGSMGMDADTEYPTGADVLVLPFQGTGDPSATVMPIVEKLQPKAIYLDHYDDAFPPLSSQIETNGFVTVMHKKGIPTVAMEYGKTYQI